MKNFKLTLAFASGLMLSGCELVTDGTPRTVIDEQTYTFDAVKLIASGFTDDDDPSTFQENSYVVSPSRRLLMRFETMSDKVANLTVSDAEPVQVWLAVTDATQATAAQSALRLCPVEKTWMMLATWARAYPIAASGVWSTPGGDFDEASCVAATAVDGKTLKFTMNAWITDEVRGRGVNYGLVLTSTAEIEVYGDSSTSLSPRLKWTSVSTAGLR